ncbi:ABC transporter permease [Nocardioides bruguierae]|uniref:ABC transporter permease n=1 Tax=Nocardioides bruguierae TaxID=2945102 RepID=A0A9X2D5A8_9ACTN|nr:ABC transporter permease [Nocardioides bruguierae]MCM0619616.1 ABC transporter permease [Nocardioides bruguierae]
MSAASHLPGGGASAASDDAPRKRGLGGYLLLSPGGLWLVVFFVVPTVTLVATSLYDPSGSLQLGYAMTWHWQNYTDAVVDYGPQLLRSLQYAVIATIACVLMGYPLAYAIAFKGGRFKNLMLVAVIAPFFTSFLVRTLSWQYILGDNEAVVSLLRWLHVLGPEGHLLATPFAVITGLTYNFLPFLVLPLYASLEKVDRRLLEAASDLYASPFTAFRKVTLPLSMPGLVAGTLLTFIPAAGDYINSELLGNPTTRMVGNEIQDLFAAGDYPTASSLSVILMAAIVLLVAIYVRRAGTEELV